jgi:predicted N-acyltransferase
LALKTKVVRRITQIPADDWNKVFPDVIENYNLFKTLDESRLEQFSFYYIVVYDRNKPVGAATSYMMDYPLDTSISGPLKRVTNAIKKLRPGIFNVKALVCGIPITRGRIGIVGKTDNVMKAILRRMEQIAKKNRASVVAFKDFDQSYDRILAHLEKTGYSRFNSLPRTELDISFADFEEYLKHLSAANRYGLRRKFRKIDNNVKIEMEVVDSLEGDALRDAYRLYLDVETKHGSNFELLTMDFFRNISRRSNGCFIIAFCHQL